MNCKLEPAQTRDIQRIWEIILQAKAQMKREGKKQWSETYPAVENIISDIERGYAYVLHSEGRIIAYGAIIYDGEPVYEHIDGEWLSDRPYVMVHRLAVADEVKRLGIGSLFMREVERQAKERNVGSFRVDTNFDNFYIQKILSRLDFTYCGEVRYAAGVRMAYEKLL